MKNENDKKYRRIALYVFFTASAVAVVVLLLVNFEGVRKAFGVVAGILSPFLWGLAIAYLLDRPACFIERRLLKKVRPSRVRVISVLIVLILFLILCAGIVYAVLPSLAENIIELVRRLPSYYADFSEYVSGVFGLITPADLSSVMEAVAAYLEPMYSDLTAAGISFTLSFLGGLFNAFIALMAAVYLLLSKESFIMQFKKLLYAFLPQKFMDKTVRLVRRTHDVLSAFLFSKLVISAGIGVVTFAVLICFDVPYSLLIGLIMGAANIIPFFGPIAGLLICSLILLLNDPVHAVILIAVTLVLQFLDGQILTPKMVGDAVGMHAFWVLFAIITAGGLFGVPGMILGVPMFSVIYTLLKDLTETKLRKKHLSTDPCDYRRGKAGKN